MGKNLLTFTQQKPSCCSHCQAQTLPLHLLLSGCTAAVQRSGCSGRSSLGSACTDNFMTPHHQEITWLGSLRDSWLIKVRFILLASPFWDNGSEAAPVTPAPRVGCMAAPQLGEGTSETTSGHGTQHQEPVRICARATANPDRSLDSPLLPHRKKPNSHVLT